MEQFCAAAKARSEAQTHFLDQDDKELDALIYFSCAPWLGPHGPDQRARF